MRRREYILAGAAAMTVAGCIGGDDESDDDDDTDDTDPVENGDDDSDGPIDGDDDGDDPEEEPPESLAEAAVHRWPLAERSAGTVEDVIGDADGAVSDGLENIAGDWHDGFAEYNAQGAQGHIDLGYLESINEAVTDHAFALVATIKPTTISPDRAMTILGAGGGESDWFEFRISQSDGSRNGQPIILIRDDFANEVRVAVTESLQPDTTSRIALSMDGNTAEDVSFWVNGEEAETEVLADGELSTAVVPEQTYGIFASNPRSEDTHGTRRWFSGTIDNVVFCDQSISEDVVAEDFEDQPWSE